MNEVKASLPLERTVCYACTEIHTCFVFPTADGIRVPLCEGCLKPIVDCALEGAQQ